MIKSNDFLETGEVELERDMDGGKHMHGTIPEFYSEDDLHNEGQKSKLTTGMSV